MHKLMIVDDSNIIRKRIERSFNSAQFELVALAEDGLDAVEKFKEHHPDVITMDLTMPNMDGLECIKQIRALDPSVSILVVSALSDKITGLRALQLGARGFISKPFTDEELLQALNQLVTARVKHKKKSG